MIRRFFAFLLAGLLLALPALGEPDLIRLHVVGRDDTEEAQRIKLLVRDAVLQAADALLMDADSPDEAYRILSEQLPLLEDAANARLRELGCDYAARAVAGVFSFPDRVYGNVTVPAGDYRAVRIELGEAEGKNWWCVLYPGLCRLSRSTAEEDAPAFYSSVGRWLKKLFFGGME